MGMGVDVLVVAKRLLRRALSVVYTSVGFFMVLAWVWRDYVGVTVIAIAYLVGASILYGHVFKPLIRFREVARVFSGCKTVNVVKYLGFTASAFGLSAIVSMVLSSYLNIPGYVTPLLGIIATVVSIILLLIGVYGSIELFDPPEIGVIVLLGLAIVLYVVKPSLVLPIVGCSFMCLGMYTYYLYYSKPKS